MLKDEEIFCLKKASCKMFTSMIFFTSMINVSKNKIEFQYLHK